MHLHPCRRRAFSCFLCAACLKLKMVARRVHRIWAKATPAYLALFMTGLGASLLCQPRPAFSQDDWLARCWSPDLLAGRAGEWRARAGRGPDHVSHLKKQPLRALPALAPALKGSLRRVKLPEGEKLIALTFDLCEGPVEISGYDGRVIDYLRAEKVKATLFVGGKWLLNHQTRAEQLLLDPLFELGSHGWSHRNLRKIRGRQLQDEISLVSKAFDQIDRQLAARACLLDAARPALRPSLDVSLFKTAHPVKKELRLFRFPYGTCSPEALSAVYQHGQLAIQWDVVSGDPAPGQSARQIAAVILARARPGSIIVAHANGRGWNTAKALPLFIPKLRAMGYRFVTVSELIAAGEPEIVPSCYENRPGDNKHY